MNTKHANANASWIGATPTYHTYPEIEHVIHTHTEVIKESVVEKEVDSRPSEVTSQSATVDINRLTDQVYSSIERKLMIEKERRGIYG
jgi:D-hexose-6-phosphate mutarotase